MPAHEDVDGRLRDLHDEYVWEVNAAVGEGREDLIRRLVDEYFDAAMRMMSAQYGGTCGRPDCAVCARPAVPARSESPRRAPWWRRFLQR
jgi:hypothetical protein